jgi:hypothetical protein
MYARVCVVMSCVGRGLAKGRPPSKESCQNVYNDSQIQKIILNRNRPDGLNL